MKAILLTLFIASAAFAGEALDQAAIATQRDLEQSLKDLATLRDQILAEKVPLTKELGAREEKLTGLRREHDRVARAQDLGNLELANLKNEIKLRQDEFAYVSNLMDEYTRGLESRLNPGELQRYTSIIEVAKAAPQQADLSLKEKAGRQLAVLHTSVARLQGLVGGTRFEGIAVDPQGTVAPGRFAMIGPVVLFAAADGKAAGVAVSQTGSTKPAVRPLDKKANVALAGIVTLGEGLLPLDPTRGGALSELLHRTSLIYYFKKGGPMMWPLLLASILALSVVIERLTFLAREKRKRDSKVVDAMLAALENGDAEAAIRCGEGSPDFIARALTYALTHRRKSLTDALMRAANRELTRFTRGISILDTIVTLAPLLGLLATVTGMMGSFGMLGGADLGAPAQITGGIAEALIGTCFGLGIAITCLLPMNYLHTQADNVRHEMEDACAALELQMKPIQEAERQMDQRVGVEKLALTAKAMAQG